MPSLQEAFNGFIRDQSDQCSKRDGSESEKNGSCPFTATNPGDLEGGTANKDDDDLHNDL